MRPRRIDDLYEYALTLAHSETTATAIGVAATVTPAGPFGLAGAVQIFDDNGEPYTRETILQTFASHDARPERTASTFVQQRLEQGIRVPADGEPANLRYALALAGIRAVTTMRAELAIAVDRGDHLRPG